MASQSNNKPPMRGFVPGLVCGLVLGAFAGAIVPPFLDSKDLPKLEDAATAGSSIQREREDEQLDVNPAPDQSDTTQADMTNSQATPPPPAPENDSAGSSDDASKPDN